MTRALALALSALALLFAVGACGQSANVAHGNIPSTATNIPVPPQQTLDPPWLQADIGTPPVAGNCYTSANVMTIQGSGDLSNNSGPDAGHFCYQQMTGNFGIKSCQQANFVSDSIWVRSGPQIRDSLDALDPEITVSTDLRNSTAPLRTSFRTVNAGATTNNTSTEIALAARPPFPCMAIERNGTALTTYYGYDISNVTTLAYTQAITFSGSIYLGLWISNALSSGNATATWSVPIIYSVGSNAGTVQFVSATQSVNEDAGTASVQVNRAGGTTGAIGVNVTNLGTGSAVAGTDYTDPPFPVALSWADGDATAKTATIAITNRPGSQSNRTIAMGLGSATGGATIGAQNTDTLTIVDLGGDPQIAAGTTNYFVAPGATGASDSNNGLYPAFVSGVNGPWATNAPANSRSWNAATDNLYILAGSTQTGSSVALNSASAQGVLTSGSCTRTFVVGAYYISAGTAFRGLNGGARPILRGTQGWWDHQGVWQGGGTANVTVPFVTTTDGHVDGYNQLLGASSEADCVRYENLEVRNWGGRGVFGSASSGFQVYNVKVENTWREGISCDNCTDFLADTNLVHGYGFNTKIPQNGYNGSAGLMCFENCIRFIERNNWIWEGWGEALNNWTYGHGTFPNNGPHQGLIENNVVVDGFAVEWYGEQRSTVIRRNIFARTSRTNYTRSGPTCVAHADEDPAFYSGTALGGALVFYANIIAGCQEGIDFWLFTSSSTWDNIEYYGNLIVANCRSGNGSNLNGLNQKANTGGKWYANWFQQYSTCPNVLASMSSVGSALFDANYWSDTPPGAVQSANDQHSGCTLTKTTGWDTLETLSTQQADGSMSDTQFATWVTNFIAGARPATSTNCKNKGTAIASRTFPAEITQYTGPASTDFDNNAYITPDIGPFRQ